MSNVANIEKEFTDKLINEKTPVSVFLKNGIKLTGIIVGMDELTIYLKNTITQMVYKQSVSTIVPGSGSAY